MNTNTWDARNLFTAEIIVSSLEPSNPIDAIMFFTRAESDDDHLFEIVAKALHTGLARYVILNRSDGRGMGDLPGKAWPGVDIYLTRLSSLGVSKDKVLLSEEARDTREEDTEYLEVALQHKFKSVAVLTQPHQILRATLGLVKEMSRRSQFLQVYCLTPRSTNWNKKVWGSQSREFKLRQEHIDDEYSRIIKYATQGDLPQPNEFFAYFSS